MTFPKIDYNNYNDYNDHNDYNYYNYYKDYNDYSDDNNYNDYTDSDLDLDWERFGELVTYSDTVHYYWQIANLNPDIYNQIVTWTAFAILAMFTNCSP